jgi:hypothetical protein
MSRSSPANFSNDSVNLFVAVELEFDSGAVRLWNGYHDATIDGDEYTGAGSFMSVGTIEESGEVSAKGTTIALSGIDASLISLALQENYQNRSARVIIGTVDNGVFTDYTLFRGRMDVMAIEESGETASIRVTAENNLIDLERPRSSRYTSEDQKTYYPGDLGLDYVADLQDKQINWGKTS